MKVEVQEITEKGIDALVLTWEAPEGTKVGDTGYVTIDRFWEEGGTRTFRGVVTSLEGKYKFRCSPFTPDGKTYDTEPKETA